MQHLQFQVLLAKLLLLELKVDRIEIGSARVSKGEFKAVNEVTSWAKEHDLPKTILSDEAFYCDAKTPSIGKFKSKR